MVIWRDDMNPSFIHSFLVSGSLNQIGISLDQEEPFSLELDIKAWLLLC